MNILEIEMIRVSDTPTHHLLRLYDRLEYIADKVFKDRGKTHKFFICEEKMEAIREEITWRYNKAKEIRGGD